MDVEKACVPCACMGSSPLSILGLNRCCRVEIHAVASKTMKDIYVKSTMVSDAYDQVSRNSE